MNKKILKLPYDKNQQYTKPREGIGKNWDGMSKLQFDFLVSQGMTPSSRLLDIGCGCLRLGSKAIPFLDKERYFGIDINQSLINLGIKHEISDDSLISKNPTFISSDFFEFEKFNVEFDFMFAHSVFTHLPMNLIQLCLIKAKKHMAKTGVFYFTIFDCPSLETLCHVNDKKTKLNTYLLQDPYHQHISFYEYLAKQLGFDIELLGDWGLVHNVQMIGFHNK
jgi:cyclopropane fatty-acyl-phospholipid synthase-like methyltransferase